MRISDWSSDVCSSDLVGAVAQRLPAGAQALVAQPGTAHRQVMLALEPFQHAILELLRCRLEAPPQRRACRLERREVVVVLEDEVVDFLGRSEEHTSELQSLMRISYAVFCLKKKTTNHNNIQ